MLCSRRIHASISAAVIGGFGPIKPIYKLVSWLIKPGIAAASIFTFRIA